MIMTYNDYLDFIDVIDAIDAALRGITGIITTASSIEELYIIMVSETPLLPLPKNPDSQPQKMFSSASTSVFRRRKDKISATISCFTWLHENKSELLITRRSLVQIQPPQPLNSRRYVIYGFFVF